MTENNKVIQTRAAKGSLGELKPVAFRLPLTHIDKLNRIAIASRINKTALIRCAIEDMEEEND